MKHEKAKAKNGKQNQSDEVWLIEGVYKHAIYTPMGNVGGCVIDADGVFVQFVLAQGADDAFALNQLKPGQTVEVEGTEAKPWPMGHDAHAVYQFRRLAALDGIEVQGDSMPDHIEGSVARLNYARHGEANGVVLDTGDFIHVRPHQFATLGIVPGGEVRASGPSRQLFDSSGRVIDAVEVNGKLLDN